MARRGQQTFSKRQREQKKAEKAIQKQARRDARKDPDTPPEGPEVDSSPGADDEAAEDGDDSTHHALSPASSALIALWGQAPLQR